MNDPRPELVEALINLEPWACEEIVRQTDGLVRTAVRQGGYYFPTAADEEELRQDLHYEIIRSIAKWNPERGSFTRWVYGIARNLLNSFIRREQERLRSEMPLEVLGEDYDPPDTLTPRPDQEIRVQPLVEAFWELYNGLSAERQRLVDHMRSGDPDAVLAQELGVSTDAVKQRTYRMRQYLARQLSPVLDTQAASPDPQ